MVFIGHFWVNFIMVIERILKKCYIAVTLFFMFLHCNYWNFRWILTWLCQHSVLSRIQLFCGIKTYVYIG